MAGALEPQLKGQLPVETFLAQHLPEIGKQAQHHRPAVPEGVEQAPRVVQVPADVLAARNQRLKPFLVGLAEKFPRRAVPGGEFLQPRVGPRLAHQAVPAEVAILPAELLQKGRAVEDLIDRRAVEIQLRRDFPRPQPVARADHGADRALPFLLRHGFTARVRIKVGTL